MEKLNGMEELTVYFDFGSGKKEYTLRQIATNLKLDIEDLKNSMLMYNGNITLATVNASQKKALKESINDLLNFFSPAYVSEQSTVALSKDLQNIKLEKKKLEHALVVSVKYQGNQEEQKLILTPTNLRLLQLITDENMNKPYYTAQELNILAVLEKIAVCDFSSIDQRELNATVDFFGSKNSVDGIIKRSFDDEQLSLKGNEMKKLLSLTSNRKLRTQDNTKVFEKLQAKMNPSNNRNKAVKNFSK